MLCFFWDYIKNTGRTKYQRGATRAPQVLPPPPPGGGGQACGLPHGPLAPLFCYMKGFVRKKKSAGGFYEDSPQSRGGT